MLTPTMAAMKSSILKLNMRRRALAKRMRKRKLHVKSGQGKRGGRRLATLALPSPLGRPHLKNGLAIMLL